MLHAILYCEAKAPDEGTHWKDEVPKLEASEIIRDFTLIGKQGTKRVFHCLVEKNAQLPRILAWIDSYNDGKTDPNKIWYWYGQSSDEAYRSLWQDANAFAHSVAERVLIYPVEIEPDVWALVTVYDAINTYGVTIVNSVLKKYGTPHRFFGAG